MRSNSCFLSRIRSYQGYNIMNEIEFLLSIYNSIKSRIKYNEGDRILAFYLEFDVIKDKNITNEIEFLLSI